MYTRTCRWEEAATCWIEPSRAGSGPQGHSRTQSGGATWRGGLQGWDGDQAPAKLEQHLRLSPADNPPEKWMGRGYDIQSVACILCWCSCRVPGVATLGHTGQHPCAARSTIGVQPTGATAAPWKHSLEYAGVVHPTPFRRCLHPLCMCVCVAHGGVRAVCHARHCVMGNGLGGRGAGGHVPMCAHMACGCGLPIWQPPTCCSCAPCELHCRGTA